MDVTEADLVSLIRKDMADMRVHGPVTDLTLTWTAREGSRNPTDSIYSQHSQSLQSIVRACNRAQRAEAKPPEPSKELPMIQGGWSINSIERLRELSDLLANIAETHHDSVYRKFLEVAKPVINDCRKLLDRIETGMPIQPVN